MRAAVQYADRKFQNEESSRRAEVNAVIYLSFVRLTERVHHDEARLHHQTSYPTHRCRCPEKGGEY